MVFLYSLTINPSEELVAENVFEEDGADTIQSEINSVVWDAVISDSPGTKFNPDDYEPHALDPDVDE